MKNAKYRVVTLALLISSAAVHAEVAERSAIEREAYLIKLIDTLNVSKFKEVLTREAPNMLEGDARAFNQIADHIGMIRDQKVTQMSQNIGRSKIAAGIKAATWATIAAGCAIGTVDLIARDFYLVFWAAQKDAEENLKRHTSAITPFTPKIRVLAYTAPAFVAVPLTLSAKWAHDNVHFLMHGNHTLLHDIKKLDQMMAHVRVTARQMVV